MVRLVPETVLPPPPLLLLSSLPQAATPTPSAAIAPATAKKRTLNEVPPSGDTERSPILCDRIGLLQWPRRDVAEARIESVLSAYAPSGSRTRRNTSRPVRTR